jgi:hypothetical protein
LGGGFARAVGFETCGLGKSESIGSALIWTPWSEGGFGGGFFAVGGRGLAVFAWEGGGFVGGWSSVGVSGGVGEVSRVCVGGCGFGMLAFFAGVGGRGGGRGGVDVSACGGGVGSAGGAGMSSSGGGGGG